MKSFKQYININESVSEFTDNIVNTLTDAGKELNFDPRNLKQHRQFGTHHDLLKGNEHRTDIVHDDRYEDIPSYDGPRTHYSFRINNLGKYDLGLKEHDSRVNVSIGHIKDGEQDSRSTEREVAFTFGGMYGDHPTLDHVGRVRATPHIFDGVMRSVIHYAIHNNIDPSKIKFVYNPFSSTEPKTTSSGKVRRVSSTTQKARIYSHIENAIRDLHSRITGKS